APRVDQPAWRVDLDERSGGNESREDLDFVAAAGPEVEVRRHPHPPWRALGVDEKLPDPLSPGRDPDLTLHRHPLTADSGAATLGLTTRAREARVPVVVDEETQPRERLWLGPVQPPGTLSPLGDQAGLLQDGDVLGDGRT